MGVPTDETRRAVAKSPLPGAAGKHAGGQVSSLKATQVFT